MADPPSSPPMANDRTKDSTKCILYLHDKEGTFLGLGRYQTELWHFLRVEGEMERSITIAPVH